MKSLLIKIIIPSLYGFLFVALWLATMFYLLGFRREVYKSGSTLPRETQIIPFNNHGEVVYITEAQDNQMQLYGDLIFVSIFLYALLGITLQWVWKIEIFRTSSFWKKPSSSGENDRP